MSQWEYKVSFISVPLKYDKENEREKIEEKLRDFSMDRWKLVSVTTINDTIYLFLVREV